MKLIDRRQPGISTHAYERADSRSAVHLGLEERVRRRRLDQTGQTESYRTIATPDSAGRTCIHGLKV